ncbi:MAG TPA: methylmalonyl Co-A mutase-associated GTPase MeaB, partial [Candidatus Cloacimonadota bacterium]|nr:methylmalonyl Co-A mutase-associated GTPase MeaB [Candidatus Cloacimonadota bacterium]
IIESNSPKDFEIGQELLKRLLPRSGNSIRIGITGVPGAGKSTFIETFGLYLIGLGKKVAVLAVDPSSSISKGSILGDKTRMERLSGHESSFIRPSPAAGVLGGVARKTREAMILCEAAGFDVILIETVGVGQSETTVRSMVDFFLLMQIAGAGDELQGIKKGIMELTDLIVVNKADGDNILAAEKAAGEYNHVLHLMRPATEHWTTKAITCSALYALKLEEIWEIIQKFLTLTNESGSFQKRRRGQIATWFENLLHEAVLGRFYQNENIRDLLPQIRQLVESGQLPVVYAVSKLIGEYHP